MKPGQRVIVTLRKMIAAGELRAGERIAEIAMAELLGVSRMPVRTALRALEQEGLVVKLGARGYAARGFSSAQIKSAIEVRGVLEGLAARQATLRGVSSAGLKVLGQCLGNGDVLFLKGRLEKVDLDAYHDFNLRFHTTVVEASQNGAIGDALARNNCQPFASADALALDLEDLDAEYRHLSAAHEQHHAIYNAIVKGDAEEAELIMRDHALAAVRNVKVFERLGVDTLHAHAAWAIQAD